MVDIYIVSGNRVPLDRCDTLQGDVRVCLV